MENTATMNDKNLIQTVTRGRETWKTQENLNMNQKQKITLKFEDFTISSPKVEAKMANKKKIKTKVCMI